MRLRRVGAEGKLLSLDGEQSESLPPDLAELVQVTEAIDRAKEGKRTGNPHYDKELRAIFLSHGFDNPAVDHIVHCIVGRRRGQPTNRHERMLAIWLSDLKKGLIAEGVSRSRIHKAAMQKLETEYLRLQDDAGCAGVTIPPFDESKLENFLKRSKKSRA